MHEEFFCNALGASVSSSFKIVDEGGGERRERWKIEKVRKKWERRRWFANSYLPITNGQFVGKLKVKHIISLKTIIDRISIDNIISETMHVVSISNVVGV